MRALKPFVPLLLLISLYAGGGFGSVLHAQPRLEVEPDTLFYSNQEGAENVLILWNEGDDSLRIDSLRFSTLGAHGWGLDLSLSDTTYRLYYAFGRLDYPAVFPEIELQSHDTLDIKLGVDPCLVCGGKSSSYAASGVLDTLFVYSSDDVNNPYKIPIDFTYYVSTEVPDVGFPLSIQVYPNPTADWATVRIIGERPGNYQLDFYNVLGQRLDQKTTWLTHGQVWEMRWPEGPLSVSRGTYIVRLTDGHTYTTKTLTLTR